MPQAFDASSIIYAWDNYPEPQFPPLWTWIARQINQGELQMSRVACEEVDEKAPDCGQWLRAQNLRGLEIGDDITQEAMRIKGLLNIVADNYHAKGVNENDVLIIATARVLG